MDRAYLKGVLDVRRKNGLAVGHFARAHDRSDRSMGAQSVPRVERKPVVYCGGPGFTPSHLGRYTDPGNGQIRASIFGPRHGGVPDRHSFEVSTELHTELPFRFIAVKEIHHSLANPVRLSIDGKSRVSKGPELGETGATLTFAI